MADLRYCDIVMKGGITSGVVYPPAIHELARKFRFKSVGGTSAGAIAAAVTAAAECGRGKPGAGFDELAKLPEWLGAKAPGTNISNLNALFQPQPATRPLFRLLATARGRGTWKKLGVGFELLRGFPIGALAGAAPGVVALIYVLQSGGAAVWRGAALVVVLAFLLAGALTGAAVRAWYHARTTLPRNLYGMCLGWGPWDGRGPVQLTEWLSRLINQLAGRAPDGPPLTFGDLWGTRDPEGAHEIELAMMTSDVTRSRPYRLPFDARRTFYFDPDEFAKLFPLPVVQWMVAHPRESAEPDAYPSLRPLPAPADLPVIVAARMSLSFPLLISAVPLYAVDRTRPADKQRPERRWFSDGGIASNFPVHFFDSVLPRWPTFAINLRPFHPDYPDRDVWMPRDNAGGTSEPWDRFDQQAPSGRLLGFVGALLGTMQNWMDNIQLPMPGYRDRVAHVCLRDDEGGMNLDMPGPVIAALGDRGRRAARELATRFTDPAHPMGWDNHRWIRLRSALAVLEGTIERMHRAYAHPPQAGQTYEALMTRGANDPPGSYRWENEAQRAAGLAALQRLVALGKEWEETREALADGAPRPRPVLRIMPRM